VHGSLTYAFLCHCLDKAEVLFHWLSIDKASRLEAQPGVTLQLDSRACVSVTLES